MIVYILKDGLGNQLFEYAYAKKLQEHTKDKIAFCTWMYNLKNFSLGGTRQCSLQHFELPEDVEILSGFKNFWYFASFMLRMFFIYKKDFISWFVLGKRVSRKDKYESDCKKGLYVSENSYEIPDFISTKKRNKYIFGNYEGIGALPENKQSAQLSVKTEATEENKKMLDKISSCEAVCLHVRRGDYLNSGNEYLQVCNYEYYKTAVEHIKNTVDNPTFFIFSNTHNDLEWIKENYDFGIEPVYVDLSNPDYEEIRLMSACKHFIIANSTFSWWAAYLSKHKNKTVVVPRTWSNRENDSTDMYLNSYVLM